MFRAHCRLVRTNKFALIKRHFLLYFLIGTTFILICYKCVVWASLHAGLQEKDFLTSFNYPEFVYNLRGHVDHFSRVKNKSVLTEMFSLGIHLNTAYSNITILKSPVLSSVGNIGLLVIVKSAVSHQNQREKIRNTWGNKANIEKYSIQTVNQGKLETNMIFVLGRSDDCANDGNCRLKIQKELLLHDDVLIGNFTDSYRNLTYKTMFAMRWAAIESGKSFQYLMYVDDDVHVNLESAVQYLGDVRNKVVVRKQSPVTGITYLEHVPNTNVPKQDKIRIGSSPLITGDLYVDSKPIRKSYGPYSKWETRPEEYTYNYYPTYIAGGATILDSNAVSKLYYGSLFTRPLWIDDVYVGIVAYKLGIPLLRNELIDLTHKKICGKRVSGSRSGNKKNSTSATGKQPMIAVLMCTSHHA